MHEHDHVVRMFACSRTICILLVSALVACNAAEDGSLSDNAPAGMPKAIEAVPVMSVGVVEGNAAEEFDRVVTPFVLPDGQLVVPVAGASEIRVFNDRGAFSHSLGGAGAGPGEFRSLSAVWSRGDTIEAFDSGLDRITRFIPGGSVEVVTLRSEVRDLSGVAGPTPEGWIIGGVALGDFGRRDSVSVHWFDRTGSDRGELGTVEGFARFRGPSLTGPEPLSPRALLQVAHGRAYLGESLTPTIRMVTPAGTLDQEISWQAHAPASPETVFRLVVDAAVSRSQPARAAAVRRQLEAAPIPERISVVWKFIVDDEGFIWIRPFEPIEHAATLGGLSLAGGGPGGTWSLLSAEGRMVGTIEVPADLEVLRIMSDVVVGLSRDELGVESVRVHRLARG